MLDLFQMDKVEKFVETINKLVSERWRGRVVTKIHRALGSLVCKWKICARAVAPP